MRKCGKGGMERAGVPLRNTLQLGFSLCHLIELSKGAKPLATTYFREYRLDIFGAEVKPRRGTR